MAGRQAFRSVTGQALTSQAQQVTVQGRSIVVGVFRQTRSHPEEARFAEIFRAFPVGVALLTDEGFFLEVNDALCGLLGYAREDLVGTPFARLVHPDEVEAAQDVRLRVVGRGETRARSERRLVRSDGTVVWVLVNTRRYEEDGTAFSVSVIEDITARRAAEDQLVALALHDSLTGLPNRRLLLDRLEQALARSRRDGRDVAVLFVDLDHVKQVNDALGHEAGDELLITAAKNLQSVVRETDTVARLGGDEFVVVVERAAGLPELETLAERMLEAVRIPVAVGPDQSRGHRQRRAGDPDLGAGPAAGPAARRRRRDVPGQAGRPRALRHRRRDGGAGQRRGRGRRATGPGGRGRPGARPARARAALPAHRRHGRRRARDGGAAALAAPGARDAAARGVPPRAGTVGAHRLVDQLGACTRRCPTRRPGGRPGRASGSRVPVDLLRDGAFAEEVLALLALHEVPPRRLVVQLAEGQLAQTDMVQASVARLHDAGVRLQRRRVRHRERVAVLLQAAADRVGEDRQVVHRDGLRRPRRRLHRQGGRRRVPRDRAHHDRRGRRVAGTAAHSAGARVRRRPGRARRDGVTDRAARRHPPHRPRPLQDSISDAAEVSRSRGRAARRPRCRSGGPPRARP